ncbi:hypothetical protein [Nocardia sp. NPDC051832]|uniref:hypothetical protein n=1 Tax=Nocardia sp. NPDC051832 TaxID=3155673 RepID=UPI003425BF16
MTYPPPGPQYGAPQGYPPGPNYGAPPPMPGPPRGSNPAVWIVVGVVAVVAVAAALFMVVGGSSGSGADTAAPESALPTSPEPPADPLTTSRAAFPGLVPQGSGEFGDAYGSGTCFAYEPSDVYRLKFEQLKSSPWQRMWECNGGGDDNYGYSILFFDSPSAAAAAVAALPQHELSAGHKAGARQTHHSWIEPDPPGPLQPYYYTANLVVSFESDPLRDTYLIYTSHHGTSRDPQSAPPPADEKLADWWAQAPL